MKKRFQSNMLTRIRAWMLTGIGLLAGGMAYGQSTTVLPNNASYSNKSAPQGGLRYQRGFYLVTPAEMNAAGMTNGMNINSIGFTYGRAMGDTAHGRFKVYLENTNDVVSRADTGWNGVTVNTNAYWATGLFPGDYEWQVRANCSSNSPYTSSVFFSNGDLSGCNSPYNLNTVAISTTGATFTWEAAASPVLVNFRIEYSRADSVNWIQATTTDTFYVASGLIPGKSYQWRVRTLCTADSSSVNLSSFTTETISYCNAPSGLASQTLNDTLTRLSWTNAAGGFYYQVQFRRVGTNSWSAASAPGDSVTVDLDPGTTYEWRVRTVCGADSTGTFVNGSNFSTGGTAVCYEPTDVITSQITPASAKLTWTPVAGATSYEVRYRLRNTISWTNATTPMTMVCDSAIILPKTAGAFDIPFHGGSPFSYTGNGMYIAWEFERPSGALTSPGLVLSTTRGTSLQGVNGQDSVTYLLCMISQADTSLTGLPSILGESRERPETRLGAAGLVDSVSVVSVFALGKTVPRFQSPTPVSALIANHSTTDKTYTVYLTVKEKQSGSVRYTGTQSLAVSAGDTALVHFNGWSPTRFETDSLIVSVPADGGENVLNNNSKGYAQLVNGSLLAYDDGTPPVGSAGFDTTGGLLLVRHHLQGCGKLVSARIFLTESAQGHPLYAVVRDTLGAIVATSASFTPGADDVNRYNNFFFTSPPAFQNADFYVGLAQDTVPSGYNPVGVQWEDALPRQGAYYRAALDGTGLVDTPGQGRLMILAELQASGAEPFISGPLVLCTGGTNTLTAGSNDTRYANSVLAYSSQYGNNNYSAGRVLGTPDVFPISALNPNTWVSATADGQREYLELGFPGAAPVNFVDIYETFNPGAVDSVFVKNPGTSNFELVYSATAASAGTQARKNRISFATTAFNVSEIRIALNSAAVGGYNAIDAVGVGQSSVPGTFSTYSWSPGSGTGNTFAVTTPGVYTLTTTDGNGCSLSDSVTVVAAVTTPPTISSNRSGAICLGDSVTLTSSQPTGNTWSTGATTQSITVSTAGSYTVTYNDGSGCGALTSSAYVVTVNSLPAVSISGNTQICPGNATTLDAGSGFSSYAWNTGETTQTISALIAGTISVMVTDNNGCRNTASVTTTYVTLSPPTITGNTSFCPGGNTTLDAGAGYSSYSWSNGATTQTITVSAAGPYSVTVTNAGGCTASNTIETTLFTPPSPIISGTPGFCAGGSTTLNAGAGYSSYSWTGGASSQTLSVSAPGTYTVTVTDANGCSGTASRLVSLFPAPTPVIGGTLSFCAGTSTTLNAGTGYASYLWSTGATSQTITVNAVGTYTVTVTNFQGCSATASASTTNTGSLPAVPGPISGPVNVNCSTTGNVYTISPVPNTSHYVWWVPAGATITAGQGTTAVTVSFGPAFRGGNIVVAASNACGQSPSLNPRQLFVKSLTDVPGAISGPSSGVCGPASRSYSIAPVPGALSYTWTAPAGASVQSGQGTNAVVIAFTAGFINGNLCVSANNACGASVPQCLFVTGAVPTPGAISGPSLVCRNERNLIFSVEPVNGATSYTWSVPQSSQISAGQGGRTIVVNMGPREGNVSVIANGACGSSAPRTLAVAFTTCLIAPPSYTMPEKRPVPEVISSYGGAGFAGRMNLEWTVGEPRVESVSKGNILFTQGFHQPLISTLRIDQPGNLMVNGIRVTAFPNPVSTTLKVRIQSVTANQPVMIELTDITGRILQRRSLVTGNLDVVEMQMSAYITGSYLLVVRDITGKIINTIKLVKAEYRE